MKINNKHIAINYIVATGVLLAAIVGITAWWYFTQKDPTNENTGQEISTVEPAPAQLSEEEAVAKRKHIEEQATKTDSGSSSDDDTSAQPATLELNTSQADGTVTIMTRLTGIGDGSCSIRVTNGSREYSDQVDVIFQPSYSTCAGFTVPISEVGNGSWQIAVEATSLDGQRATSNTTFGVT